MQQAATFKAIANLLNPARLEYCNNATLRIEEKGRQATMRLVDIVSVGAGAFSIKYDECGFPGQVVFAPHLYLHRGCDSVAFCEVEGKPYILCIELKSSEPTRHEVTQQFSSAHCFLDYLNTLLQTYCAGLNIKDWERRYFVFHNQPPTPLAKRTSRPEYDNSDPSKAMFIATHSGCKPYLRQLLGIPL